ncbi:MAG: acetyl-CoA carboxylase biotin carboxyl carrier protein [Oscillospiraceae bacterium]
MEKRDIFELLGLFDKSSLTDLNIEDGETKVSMKKPCFGQPAIDTEGAESKDRYEGEEHVGDIEQDDIEYIRSPIVGVYYAAPSPDEAHFVAVGDRVDEGQTLCIIEAMKVMNELKSPCAGTIQAIYGMSGSLAEYGQILFDVKKC